jgi:hypothetical protein
MFKSLSSTVEKQLKALNAKRNLVVYLFLQGGRIAVVKITETQRKDLTSICFVSDRNNAGLNKDNVSMRFSQFVGRLVGQSEIVKPSFSRSRTYKSRT